MTLHLMMEEAPNLTGFILFPLKIKIKLLAWSAIKLPVWMFKWQKSSRNLNYAAEMSKYFMVLLNLAFYWLYWSLFKYFTTGSGNRGPKFDWILICTAVLYVALFSSMIFIFLMIENCIFAVCLNGLVIRLGIMSRILEMEILPFQFCKISSKWKWDYKIFTLVYKFVAQGIESNFNSETIDISVNLLSYSNDLK